jgi:hypothetical protein
MKPIREQPHTQGFCACAEGLGTKLIGEGLGASLITRSSNLKKNLTERSQFNAM